MISKNSPCTNLPTISVSNVKMHTLVVKRTVLEPNKSLNNSSLKSWFAVNALQARFRVVSKVAKHTGQNTSTLNASSAVILLNGSVGETPTFVRAVTQGSAKATT